VTIKINPADLSPSQKAELFNHFGELDEIRLAGAGFLINSLLSHPDCPESFRGLLKVYSDDVNAVTERSAAEIARIVGPKVRSPLN
jgi:hypothetical protein